MLNTTTPMNASCARHMHSADLKGCIIHLPRASCCGTANNTTVHSERQCPLCIPTPSHPHHLDPKYPCPTTGHGPPPSLAHMCSPVLRTTYCTSLRARYNLDSTCTGHHETHTLISHLFELQDTYWVGNDGTADHTCLPQ
jgi:hypothetical protein